MIDLIDPKVKAAAMRRRKCQSLGCDSVTTHPKCPYHKRGDEYDDMVLLADAYLDALPTLARLRENLPERKERT